MNILALDTSMGVCSAAVLRTAPSDPTRFLREEAMVRGHAEALMPMIEAVLTDAGLAPGELDAVAATQGPGSFTGVRIAIAAARGLALTTNAVLFGTDSLTVMAQRALTEGLAPHGPFAIAADARRGMLYLGTYNPDGSRLEGPGLFTPDDAATRLPENATVTAGSGARLLANAAAAQGRRLETAFPDLQPGAMALAELAEANAGLAGNGQRPDAREPLRPLYLRPPDAKPQKPALERR